MEEVKVSAEASGWKELKNKDLPERQGVLSFSCSPRDFTRIIEHPEGGYAKYLCSPSIILILGTHRPPAPTKQADGEQETKTPSKSWKRAW